MLGVLTFSTFALARGAPELFVGQQDGKGHIYKLKMSVDLWLLNWKPERLNQTACDFATRDTDVVNLLITSQT